MKRAHTLPLQEVKVGAPVVWRIAHYITNRWQRGTIAEVDRAFVKVQPRHPRHHAHWLFAHALRMERPVETREAQS